MFIIFYKLKSLHKHSLSIYKFKDYFLTPQILAKLFSPEFYRLLKDELR